MNFRAARRRLAVVVLTMAPGIWACRTEEPPPANPAASQIPAAVEPPTSGPIAFTPPPPAYRGELPPLPVSPYPSARPPEVVRAVYSFAARHPEVLHYVPCFCGCQNAGHKDNDDCFIKSRDANGRPTWEPHGMT